MWLEQMRQRGLADAQKSDVRDLAHERFRRRGELPEGLDASARTAFILDYLRSGAWAERPHTRHKNTPAGGAITITDRAPATDAHDIAAFDLALGCPLRRWTATRDGTIHLQFAAAPKDNCTTDLEVCIDLTPNSVTTSRHRVDTPRSPDPTEYVEQPWVETRLLAVWALARPTIELMMLWSNHRYTSVPSSGDRLFRCKHACASTSLAAEPALVLVWNDTKTQ